MAGTWPRCGGQFPQIAGQIGDAVGAFAAWETPDFADEFAATGFFTLKALRLGFVAPRPDPAILAARRLLPLDFTRQAATGPTTVSIGRRPAQEAGRFTRLAAGFQSLGQLPPAFG